MRRLANSTPPTAKLCSSVSFKAKAIAKLATCWDWVKIPPANALSVNVCAPLQDSKTGTTITFRGAGNAFNGIAKRMELWIDGTKVGEDLEDQLKITAALAKGSHTASFVVVDTFDNTASKSVTFTVN